MAARTTAVVSFAIFFIFDVGCSWRGAVANGGPWGGCVDNGSSCGIVLKLSNRFFGALKFETKKSPLPGGPYRGSAARQNEVGLAARAAASCRAPAPAPPSCIAITMRSMQPILPLRTVQKIKLVTRRQGRAFYPDEIEIQGPHSDHRKLDSQATLSHRARGRAPDGLRPKAWPLWASRRDHDPGGLSTRSAGLRGVRPAMAADRAVREPLA